MEAFLDQLNEVVLTLQDFMSGKLLVVLLVSYWFVVHHPSGRCTVYSSSVVLLNPFSATSNSTVKKQAKTV